MLRLLVKDASVFSDAPPLTEEQFSSPLLGRAFTQLWNQRQAGREPSVPLLAETFSQEEISHLIDVTERPESLANAAQALADYIRIIQSEWAKRSGGDDVDPLLAATEKYKDKKGIGGKQHG